ncbi:MAG: ecdysteroid 22-kinase family protein [Chloroflexi bacterium]|nr:ecdysteroid 22-kinase family protein [Chloroflexota bacterium]
MSIPAHALSFLEPTWLTERLRLGGWPAAQVLSATAQPLTDAVAADAEIWRLHLVRHPENNTMPVSLILKLTHWDATLSQEARFYAVIAPHVAVRTPRCYFAGYFSAEDYFALLMEDLAPFVPGDQVAGCNVRQARLAMETLARLHAECRGDLVRSLNWIGNCEREWSSAADAFLAAWPRFLASFAPDLPASAIQKGWEIGRQLLALEERLLHASEPTLVHGDYRAENLLFGPSDDDAEITVLDWEEISAGNGLYDVAYLLLTSVDATLRRREEPALLASYATMAGLDSTSVQRSYALARCTAISQVVLAADDLSRGSSRQRSLAHALAHRVLAGLADARLPL